MYHWLSCRHHSDNPCRPQRFHSQKSSDQNHKIYPCLLRGVLQRYSYDGTGHVYFGSSALFNINMSMWFAAILIVSINTGAYMAETVRGGILSIDEGQTEGAKAIGMTHVQTMINVILPQALRNIMPQIGNNLIINIKDTCVLSIIGTVELFYATKGAAGALYTYFEAFTIAMVIYFIMTFTCSRILRVLEHKMDGPDNYDLATADTLTHTSGMYSYKPKKEKKYE